MSYCKWYVPVLWFDPYFFCLISQHYLSREMWCLLWMKAQNVTIYRTISEHPRQTPQAQLSFGGGVVCCFCRSSTPLFCFLQSALNFWFVVGARNTTWSSLQLLICFNKFLVGFWPTLHLNHYEVMKGNETFQFQVLLRLVFFYLSCFQPNCSGFISDQLGWINVELFFESVRCTQ